MRSSATVIYCFLLFSSSWAATLHVPADQPTIQTAINVANSGDTIRIAPGDFKEDLLIDHKSIHLIGSGSDSTILDGSHKNYYDDILMKGPMSPATTIRDMTISGNKGILLLDSASLRMEYCCLRNFNAAGGFGIISSQGEGLTTSATIRFNVFHDNSTDLNYNGLIYTGYYTTLWFEGNLVVNNSGPNTTGIACIGSSVTIVNNTIINNDFGQAAVGLYQHFSNDALIEDNIICFNSAKGIEFSQGYGPNYEVEYNDVFGNPGGDFAPDSIGSSPTNLSVDPQILPVDFLPDSGSPVIGAASDGGNMGIYGPAPTCGPEPTCGDGVAEEGEECDDGNLRPCDGCSDACTVDLWAGDTNGSGTYTSSDIIYLVNYVFKGGPPPVGGEATGDTNCDGIVTSADIIRLVPYIFIGATRPCRLCDSPL